MTNGPDFSALGQVFPQAKSVVCFIHPQATYDAVAAALTLSLAAHEAGKSCEVVCEEPMRVEYNYLVGIDQIQQSVGNRDLVISFAYNEEQVDKVSYNIDEQNKRFELIIAPKTGAQPLDPGTLAFTRSGLSADVVFLFGYHSLSELGAVYEKERYVIDRAYTVAFTQNKIQTFAKLHMALKNDNYSYSEMVYFMIRQLQIAEVKGDMATNILSGLEYATERLMQGNLPARIFETMATLLRQGGQRRPDNPAFEHLNTPIRQVEAANAGQSGPMSDFGNVGAQMPQQMPQMANINPQSPQPMGQPVSLPLQQPMAQAYPVTHQPVQPQFIAPADGGQASASQHVSASEFAQVMQSGGHNQ